MKRLFQNASRQRATIALVASVLAVVWQAQAQTPVTVNNSGFETPVIGTSDGDLTQSHGTPNSPSGESYEYAAMFSGSFTGWNVNYTSTNGMQATGQSPNWGVDDPASSQFSSSEPNPPPFDGNQYFYINLRSSSDGTSLDSGELTSDSLGTLAAGTYNLTLALGERPQTSWRGIDYQVGLYDLTTSSYLGTLAQENMVPDNSAGDVTVSGSSTTPVGFANNYNIVDLTYLLNVNPGDGAIGDDYAIGVNFFMDTSTGNATGTFTQGIVDNARLTFVPVPEPGTMALALLGMCMLMYLRPLRRYV